MRVGNTSVKMDYKTSDRTNTFLAGEYGKHFLVANYFDCVGDCVGRDSVELCRVELCEDVKSD
jgi:hypothetical protein